MGYTPYRKYQNTEERLVRYFLIFLAILSLMGISTCVWYIWPRKVSAQVIGSDWTYTHYLRQKTKMHFEGWGRPHGKDVVPGTLDCHRKYYGQERVCTGFDENRHCYWRSIHKDWCIYDHWEWPIIKSDSTHGYQAVDPTWPALAAEGPDQRIDKVAKYEIIFQSEKAEDKRKFCECTVNSLAELRKFVLKDWWLIQTNAGFKNCKPLNKQTAEGI